MPVRSWFLRLLAVNYLCAFLSLYVQLPGLIGARGILPAVDFLRDAAAQTGSQRFWMVPTLAWIDSSDVFLRALCLAGAILALAATAGLLRAPVFAGLWVLYLSFVAIGQDFLGFQWDSLLLEAGFLAILFAGPAGQQANLLVLWLYRILLFRLMFSSGVVKLASGDPAWRNWTALNYHYETQPLPNPLAWLLHNMSPWTHTFATGLTFGIELLIPFLLFAPRRLRLLGGVLMAGLQLAILATGNYAFFNLLTLALCLLSLDADTGTTPEPRPKRILAAVLAVPIGIAGAVQLVAAFGALHRVPQPAAQVYRWLGHFGIVNPYGLFAVMTTTRPEIVVEGSNDGETWLAYEFPYKPGDLQRRPPIVAPHQPRLDWQMWFAALSNYRNNPWFSNFLVRLMEGSPDVLSLLSRNPFPASPPRYIRAELYQYRFTTPAERRRDGTWWKREYLGRYFPVVSLKQ